ncbi:MAG: uroporphyrinogen decarboxylase family protein, partial [Planctomycetota bacterium]
MMQTEGERRLHREEMAQIYVDTAERFEHSAIFLHPNPATLDETMRLIDLVRERTGDRYFLMLHGDATHAIPTGETMVDFACRLADEPDKLKQEAEDMLREALERGGKLAAHGGLDGFALCCDYCFNTGPFLSPAQFS